MPSLTSPVAISSLRVVERKIMPATIVATILSAVPIPYSNASHSTNRKSGVSPWLNTDHSTTVTSPIMTRIKRMRFRLTSDLAIAPHATKRRRPPVAGDGPHPDRNEPDHDQDKAYALQVDERPRHRPEGHHEPEHREPVQRVEEEKRQHERPQEQQHLCPRV